MYGEQLRQVLKSSDYTSTGSLVAEGPSNTAQAVPQTTPLAMQPQLDIPQRTLNLPDKFQFSTMSDVELTQILNEPGTAFDPFFEGFSWDDFNNFDWIHWPDSI